MPSTPDDTAAQVQLVRLRISDVHEDESKRLLTDEQLQALLEASGSTYRASAEALRIIAASEVLVSKAIRTQDLQTSGHQVAEALRKLAADYDSKADDEDDATMGGFFIVNNGPASRLETEEWRRAAH